ncbi:MAG: HIT family protein [Candidatus Aenigmarchaeota archaeon]|nr:HIT family protein [Candidatus Aenigmarchaeota archaeon]
MPEELTPEQTPEQIKQQCIFCHIIAGAVASKKVFEDEKVTAVLDINPANFGHVLLMPKEHFAIMPQIPDDIIGHMGNVSKGISLAMLKAFGIEGTTTFVANGMAAGQRAQHFMIHIIPRTENDGVGITSFDGKPASPEMLAKIKNALHASVKKLLNFDIPEQAQNENSQKTKVPTEKVSLDDIASLLGKK